MTNNPFSENSAVYYTVIKILHLVGHITICDCGVLHCIALHYRISSHRIASHRIASHRIASHRIASHRIASHRIASHRIVSYRIVSYRIVSYRIVLYCIVLYCIVLYCIVLYCIVLYCIVLYCIVLYCIVLYCIVLYCIVLYVRALRLKVYNLPTSASSLSAIHNLTLSLCKNSRIWYHSVFSNMSVAKFGSYCPVNWRHVKSKLVLWFFLLIISTHGTTALTMTKLKTGNTSNSFLSSIWKLLKNASLWCVASYYIPYCRCSQIHAVMSIHTTIKLISEITYYIITCGEGLVTRIFFFEIVKVKMK